MTDESTFESSDIASQRAEAGGSDEAEKRASLLDREALFKRLRRWFKQDKRHSEDWRRDAETEFDFVAGRQWSAEDIAYLREQMRPSVAFNRIAPVISAVSGTEVTNRQEVRYLPRTEGDAAPDEMLSAVARWFRDECNAEDEESDAFMDTLICGMGWTESRMNFETDQDGAPMIDRVDPLEMFWDANAKKRNLEDARRIWRVKKVSLDEAISLVGHGDVDEDDFNASWANFDDRGNKDETRQEARFYRPDGRSDKDTPDDLITLVECQWWERETVYVIADELGQMQFLSAEDWDKLEDRSEELGQPLPKYATQTKRRYYRAWLGAKVLADPDEEPFGPHFSYQSITGYRDRNKGTFYGLVRGMRDPQVWANKFLSQTMHILNTSAKGGALVEENIFSDEREAEKNWSRPDAFIKVKPGTLSNASGPKIQPKPQAAMPPELSGLMQFSLQSIRDASGVNLELLGMKDQEQAGVLEMQRKKQALAVLAVLFDSLRRYRKNQGRLLLWLIQNFVSDGRMIRVAEDLQPARYVPFIRQPDFVNYDVIVDDSPSSPQQKELTWAVLIQMLPMVKDQMTPELYSTILDYSPLPESAVEKIKQAMMQAQQKPPPPQQQLAMAGAQAKVEETKSKANLNNAKAQREHVGGMVETAQAVAPAVPPMAIPPGMNGVQ